MKNIRKLNSILFDAAGAGYFILGIGILFFCPFIIALIIWAVKLIKKAKQRKAGTDRERKAQD